MRPSQSSLTCGPHAGSARWVAVGLLFALAIAPGSRAQSGQNQSQLPGGFPRNEAGMSVVPKLVCFPPYPPPLDRPITHITAPVLRQLTPPAELTSYVNEIFYPPLSTWLAEQSLTDELRQRLDAYRSEKLALLRDLRAVLDQNRETDPGARRTALEALARQQAPRLAKLDQMSEQLRSDLTTSGNDWRALRSWSLGEKNSRGDSPAEISTVMRAYAHYQANLSPAQRQLLREISMEIALAQEDEAAAKAAQPFLFFSPAPARVMLPDDLPSDLAAKISAYETAKSALKKELFDTIYKQDGAAFGFARNKAISDLAKRQSDRFAELERLADDIRGGLAQVPSAVQPAAERSPLPPVLTERIGRLLKQRTALQKETSVRMEAIRTRHAADPVLIAFAYESDGLRFLVIPRRGRGDGGGETKTLIQSIEAELGAVSEQYGRNVVELLNEIEAVRQEAGRILGKTDPKTIEAAIGAATRVAALQETEDGYREYRTAVFEPGLLPAQRRLLFDGAIEKLDLPLPRGEPQPTRRASSW